MHTRPNLLMVVALLGATLFGANVGFAGPATLANQAAPIRLKAATFIPTRGQAPAIPPGLAIGGYAQGQRGYYIIQFRGPVEQGWKDQVAAQGAEILDYIPEFAFKVRMSPAQASKVANLAEVAWVGVFQPAYKISPELDRSGARPLTVRVERGADAGLVAAEIARSGAQILAREDNTLLIAANAAQAEAAANVLDVAWVQNFTLWEKHDQYARGIMGAVAANGDAASAGRGYNGSTQTVAVADTGLGNGTPGGAHLDINDRVTAIYNWPGTADSCFQTIVDDGAQDVGSGHGTHVAGSVLSNGANSPGGLGEGAAPAARLVFQATENYVVTSNLCKAFYGYQNDYYLTGLPADLRTLFQQAYNAGARVHANSWGSAAAGDYTANSANADDFIWNHRDMAITFSAGNEGIDANADGQVDNDSIGAPATAKNVITIGASENNRQGHYECDSGLSYTSRDTTYQNGQTCTSMGGQNQLGTSGQRWGADFPAPPISTDLTAGNAEQIASFSSRGPTDDGRIKPDVVAPGTWILSTYSDLYQEGYDGAANPRNNAYQSDGWGMPANRHYKYFGGTSMSNPLAAGAAAVVRDYYQKAYNLGADNTAGASSALVKATLINSAVDIQDENNDGSNDNDFPIPNNHEGWGLINLDAATDGTAKFVDNSAGLTTGASRTYDVGLGSGPLKITLVWSDYPSTEAATANLVNNLNLTVTAPGGAVYRGNIFSGGWSQAGGAADTKNNVENVYIQSPAAGTWRIEISGANVPNGPQPFALVVGGAATLTDTTPAPATPSTPSNLAATAISRTQINLSWADTSNNETGFRIERCKGATCTNFAQIASTSANVTAFSNSGLAKNSTYRYRVRAYNASGNSGYSNIATATTPRN